MKIAIREFEWDKERAVLVANADKIFNTHGIDDYIDVVGDTKTVRFKYSATKDDRHVYLEDGVWTKSGVDLELVLK